MHDKFKDILLELYKKCENGEQTPYDFGQLICSIRTFKNCISTSEATSLLNVAYDILLNHVKLKAKTNKWSSQNSNYFAGNMVPYESEITQKFTRKYSDIFKSANFDLTAIILELRDIIDNYDELKNDFYLRNPEVTLRDDVEVINKKEFSAKGKEYAFAISKVLI